MFVIYIYIYIYLYFSLYIHIYIYIYIYIFLAWPRSLSRGRFQDWPLGLFPPERFEVVRQ